MGLLNWLKGKDDRKHEKPDEAGFPYLVPPKRIVQADVPPEKDAVPKVVGSLPSVDPIRPWMPGEVIEGRYEVLEALTGGAMGQIYRVKHCIWAIELVIKSPQPHLIANEALQAWFLQEAESWIELGLHPHITTCYYVARIEGIPRIVLEYVEGGTLKEWMAQGVFFRDWESSLRVAIQLCLGLEYAHQQGVIHRDLKPANVLMTKEGIPKLTDFGLVKRGVQEPRLGEHDAQNLKVMKGTQAGVVLGTPEYMAPEQWVGAEQTGTYTDIYALGIVLYELFCGRRPFELSETLRNRAHPSLQQREWERLHTETQVPDPRQWRRDIPKELAILLTDCLAKAPADRPTSVTAVRERLDSIYRTQLGREAPYTQAAAVDLRADSLNNRALSYLDLGRETEALAAWQAALAADPQHLETIYNRGLFLWRQGRLTDDMLVRQLDDVQTTHGNRWQAKYLLALVHLERGEPNWATLLLTEAVEQAPWEAELQTALRLARSRTLSTRRFARILEGHISYVSSVCLSADGLWALSGSGDHTLRLWEIATGLCLRTFEGHANPVSSVYLSANGRWVLSGSGDNTLRLWEVVTGRCLRVFEGHTKEVTSVCLSTDGRYALSGSRDNTLRLWEVVTGRCLRVFEGHTKEVTSVCLSTDGRYALSGSGDNTLRLWEVVTGRCLRVFEGHTKEVTSVCLSTDGQFALSGSRDKTLRLWGVTTGQCWRVFEGHSNSILSICLSADGRFALSGSLGKTLRLWEVTSGRCLRTFEGHTDWVTSVCLSADKRWALSGSSDKTLRLWELPRDSVCSYRLSRPRSQTEWLEVQTRLGELLKKAEEALKESHFATALALMREARELPGCERAPQSLEAWVKLSLICPRVGLRTAWLAKTFEGHQNGVNSVCLGNDGQWALSGGGDNTLRLWQVSTGRCLRTFPGHTSSVLSVCLSADGRWVLSGSVDNTLRLWEVATGRCLRIFKGHTSWVRSVCLSPDGRWALSAGGNNILLWELATGRCLRTFQGHKNSVLSICFSADGCWVLSGSADNTLRLWEVATGRCLQTFEGHTSWVRSIDLSTDGRWALSGGGDNTVRLWQISTGRCLRTFEGHTEGINSACLSADGRWALSGGGDNTVRLWQISTGRCLRTFEGHTGPVRSVCLSANGHWALSGGSDGILQLWQLDWELEARDPARWNEGALPYLKTFLTLHTPYVSFDPTTPEGLVRRGKPSWTEQDFQVFIQQLQYSGYGRLRPEGIRTKLEELTQSGEWDGSANWVG